MPSWFAQLARHVRTQLPQSCLLCNDYHAQDGLCNACQRALPAFSSSRCIVCATPLAARAECGACLRQRPAFDRIVPGWPYVHPLDCLIHALKYSGRMAAAPALAGALAEAIQGSSAPDLIVPLPLAPKRLAERGFNQSQEIAGLLAQATSIDLATKVLTRMRDTFPQSMLPWKERARNVRGAFQCETDVSGLHIALVDDVLTTGATLHEAARALKKKGARKVSGWVVARALPRSSAFARL